MVWGGICFFGKQLPDYTSGPYLPRGNLSHSYNTSSILLYPSFVVLSFRSQLSFFSLLTPLPHLTPILLIFAICGFDIKVAENINPG